jgi:hypothetical protein
MIRLMSKLEREPEAEGRTGDGAFEPALPPDCRPATIAKGRSAFQGEKEGRTMSLNAKALLLAGSLILASGVGVIYLNAERVTAPKQTTMMISDESMTAVTKRIVAPPSTSVYGLPTQVTPVSIRIRE